MILIQALKELAERDNVPQATKAIHLIKIALEIDEDEVWNALACKSDTKGTAFLYRIVTPGHELSNSLPRVGYQGGYSASFCEYKSSIKDRHRAEIDDSS